MAAEQSFRDHCLVACAILQPEYRLKRLLLDAVVGEQQPGSLDYRRTTGAS